MAVLQVLSALFVAWLSIASAYPTAEVNPAEVSPEVNGTITKRYRDGEGSYVGSDDGHRYASGDKCWTDWFVVSQGIEYGNWYPASNKVYCTGTNLCNVAKMTGTQNCETWSISVTAGIQSKVFNFAITAGYDVQKCKSAADTTTCSWNDGQCHIIWAQQQYLVQKGYQRRRCHKFGKKTGDDYTAWMNEWTHRAPTSSLNYGCGSKCSDSP